MTCDHRQIELTHLQPGMLKKKGSLWVKKNNYCTQQFCSPIREPLPSQHTCPLVHTPKAFVSYGTLAVGVYSVHDFHELIMAHY